MMVAAEVVKYTDVDWGSNDKMWYRLEWERADGKTIIGLNR